MFIILDKIIVLLLQWLYQPDQGQSDSVSMRKEAVGFQQLDW